MWVQKGTSLRMTSRSEMRRVKMWTNVAYNIGQSQAASEVGGHLTSSQPTCCLRIFGSPDTTDDFLGDLPSPFL